MTMHKDLYPFANIDVRLDIVIMDLKKNAKRIKKRQITIAKTAAKIPLQQKEKQELKIMKKNLKKSVYMDCSELKLLRMRWYRYCCAEEIWIYQRHKIQKNYKCRFFEERERDETIKNKVMQQTSIEGVQERARLVTNYINQW